MHESTDDTDPQEIEREAREMIAEAEGGDLTAIRTFFAVLFDDDATAAEALEGYDKG